MKKNKLLLPDDIISIIVITHNDESIIKDTLHNINRVLSKTYHNYEIILVDNSSEDNTVEETRKSYLKNSHVRIIRLSKNYSTELALTAGLDNCIGDFAILFNIYTDPPIIIPALIDNLLSDYDIVIARYKDNLIRRGPLSSVFLSLVKKLTNHGLYYDFNYLTGFNRNIINSITRIRRKNRNFSYINSLIGFRKLVIEYKPLKNNLNRLKGENFFKLAWRIIDIIISNSFKPMRILVVLGMSVSLLFLIYVFGLTLLTFIFRRSYAPEGWISISSVLGTMFFLLFSLLSLISEYIIRILDESRNEPLYFIADEIDKSIIPVRKNKLNVV